jgi:hypothetical protein
MDKKSEKLRGGVAVLFGDAPASQPQHEEVEVKSEKELQAEAVIDTLQDEELKEKLRQRQLEGRGRKRGRPHDSKTDGYGTVCVKANLEKWEKLKVISLRETLQIKEVLELALDKLIAEYEAEKGEIRLKPASKKGNVFNK